ncbi:MAG: hypothetical protein ACREGJ_02910 [Candidatus Saccharimonadales bacterium]
MHSVSKVKDRLSSPFDIKLKDTTLEVGAVDTPFTCDYIVEHIKLPKSLKDIPNIIGWAGPARSGTTSLLFLLASSRNVDRAYFQPIKTLLRLGRPDFDLGSGGIVCMKEVFRNCCPAQNHDPIEMLLRAGVPAEKITWLAILRDPVQTFASWTKHMPGSSVQDFYDAQVYTVDFYHKYKKMGVNIIPFAYDVLQEGEDRVLKLLLERAGLSLGELDLHFDVEEINKKMAYGQAEDIDYFNMSIRPTLQRGHFVYSSDNNKLPEATMQEVKDLCQKRYEEFYQLSRQELGL